MGNIEISSFILNRNDVEYYYVEGKNSFFHGPMYHFHYAKDKAPICYSASNFVEVHGLDDKKSVTSFIKNALTELTILQGVNPKIDATYEQLYNLDSKVRTSSNPKNPSLGKYKKTLIEVLENYNEIKELLPQNPSIPFEENYELVKERENIYSRENYNIYEENSLEDLQTSQIRGHQRTLRKYDN